MGAKTESTRAVLAIDQDRRSVGFHIYVYIYIYDCSTVSGNALGSLTSQGEGVGIGDPPPTCLDSGGGDQPRLRGPGLRALESTHQTNGSM